MLIWMGQHGATPILAVWSNSLVQFQFFAAGGLIALLIDQRRLSISFVLRLLLLAAGIALWFLAAVRFQLHSVAASNPRQLVGGYFVVIAGTVMIFLSVLDSRVRPPSIVLYLGKISYGLYLFHQFWLWLIFDNAEHWRWLHSIAAHEEAGAAIALGGTVMTAMLSYHFFEKPILRFKERFETIRTRPA
jgi:peptidoglycan/LPS O-acetylase OafA/YrhL